MAYHSAECDVCGRVVKVNEHGDVPDGWRILNSKGGLACDKPECQAKAAERLKPKKPQTMFLREGQDPPEPRDLAGSAEEQKVDYETMCAMADDWEEFQNWREHKGELHALLDQCGVPKFEGVRCRISERLAYIASHLAAEPASESASLPESGGSAFADLDAAIKALAQQMRLEFEKRDKVFAKLHPGIDQEALLRMND